jgi:hypothetical protein
MTLSKTIWDNPIFLFRLENEKAISALFRVVIQDFCEKYFHFLIQIRPVN